MQKLAVLLSAFVALFGLLALPALADNHQRSVNATVTAKLVSIAANPTSLAYGTLAVGTNGATPTDKFFSVTNNGSVGVKLTILGGNSTNWTLVDSNPGANQYVHRFTTESSGGNGVNFTTLSSSVAKTVFGNNTIAPGSPIDIYLNLDMPSTTTFFAQQTLPVTVTATEAAP
jgi:hypothetical protein